MFETIIFREHADNENIIFILLEVYALQIYKKNY